MGGGGGGYTRDRQTKKERERERERERETEGERAGRGIEKEKKRKKVYTGHLSTWLEVGSNQSQAMDDQRGWGIQQSNRCPDPLEITRWLWVGVCIPQTPPPLSRSLNPGTLNGQMMQKNWADMPATPCTHRARPVEHHIRLGNTTASTQLAYLWTNSVHQEHYAEAGKH